MSNFPETVAEVEPETGITEDELVGTHEYENVLYTGETEVVNVLTGETPADLDRTVEEAKAFAEKQSSDKPYVAKRSRAEAAVETRSAYSACVFYHLDITGGMNWHKAFGAAWQDPDYEVSHDADYETGTLTITVERQE